MSKQWFVGWNQPGYLPEDEPYAHDSWEAAKADIIEELHRAADDYGEENPDARKPYELAIASFESAPSNEPAVVLVGSYVWWINASEPDA